MTFDQILAGVKEEIAATLNLTASEITDERLLVADLGAESIDFIDLTFRLEQRFRLEIPEGELFESTEPPAMTLTVGAVAAYLFNKLTPAS
ncbi:MAG: phosphopantetheine-binding protein [Verrucomicrobiales bacterium]|jgi:acyl carrier protein|nr:phosphopantetheine-binding protein [Verrucomicrobiales bacterium]